MCVALPGIVKEIDVENNYATVEFSGNRVKARMGLVEVINGISEP